LKKALNAPDRWSYSALAIAAPKADEFEALDLYHATTGGEAALARKHRDDAIRTTGHAQGAGSIVPGVDSPSVAAAE
jgi:hypothetical protein